MARVRVLSSKRVIIFLLFSVLVGSIILIVEVDKPLTTQRTMSGPTPQPAELKQTMEALLNGTSPKKVVPDQPRLRRMIPDGVGRLSSDELTERVKKDLEQIAALAKPHSESLPRDHPLSKDQLKQLLSLEGLYSKGRPSKIISNNSNRVTAIFPDFDIVGVSYGTSKDMGEHISAIVEDHRELFGIAENGAVSSSDTDCIEEVCRTVIKKSFGGLPAWDHELVFTTNEEKLYSIQGEFHTPDVSSYPNERLSEETLKNLVAEHFGKELEQLEFQSPELGITLDNGRDFLAYKLEVGLGKYKRFEVYVDIQSRRIPKVIPLVQHGQVTASGIDLAGNSVSFQAESRSGIYDLKDARFPLNGSTHVYSAEDKTGYEENYTSDVYYISSGSQDFGWDPAGVSAINNAKTLVDYFKENHSFDAPSRGEQDITIGVNLAANNNGLKDNALALGNNLFIFGAGNGVTRNNWALGLDVMAHEITHGVISSTSRLVYRHQSGALNESFADFFGAMTDTEDWLIGEDIYIQKGKFLRSMSNPQDQNADPPQPAHMAQFNSAGGVHSNSGIFNRGLYLLAEGLTSEGLGTSVGRTTAANIAFKTMRSLSPNSSFDQAATAMIAAAQAEYGASSSEVIATSLAMKSIGLPEDTYTTISTSGIISPTSTAAVYLYPRYAPSNYGPTDAGSNEYEVYVQYFTNNATSYNSETDFGPLPGLHASLKRPSLIITDDGSFRFIYEGKSDGKLYSYSSASASTEEVVVGDYTISNLALSNDFSTLVFTIVESPTIYVLDLESMALSTHIVRGPSTSQAGSAGQTAAYVDSIRYDPTQRYVVFDYLSCGVTTSVCNSSNTSSFWTIGFMDVQSGNFSYPFPSQSPTLDVGYPAFSNTTDRYIVFDIVNYAADTESGYNSGVYLYDIYDGGSPRYIGNTDNTSSALGYFGTPSFTSDDSGVIYTWRTDKGSTLWRAGIQNYSRDGTYYIINNYNVFQPMAIPTVATNRSPILALSSNALDFGDVAMGEIATAQLCAQNSGHFPIELGVFAASNDAVSWSAENQVILDGQQVCGSLSIDSGYYSKGKLSTTESLTHNGSNSPKALTINARFDLDTDSDGTLDYADADDDNDGVLDTLDTYPLISLGGSTDTDGDGRPDDCDTDCIARGMVADADDDNDGVLDTLDTYPLVSLGGLVDTDGDGRPDDCDSDCIALGMAADADDDNDGVLDASDAFPLDTAESTDTDGDLIGNNADLDDDGDGFSDAQEVLDGTDPLNEADCSTCAPAVSGIAYHWNTHALMASVDVNLVGMTEGVANDFSQETTSNTEGLYAFTEKYRGVNRMTVSKAITDGESRSVISSADALAALKMAVGINPNADPDGPGPEEALPVSPYQYIAADVTGDGKITSADALAILKMAVELASAEPRRWVFVAEDTDFWNEASGSFKTTRQNITRGSDEMTFDYPEKSVQNVVGVLMGDVNGSWSAPEGSETVTEHHFREFLASQGGSLSQWGLKDSAELAFGEEPTLNTTNEFEDLNDGTSTQMAKQWFQNYSGSQEESHGHFMLATSDNGFLQVGETGFIPVGAKILVVKVDENGSLLWRKEFGSLGHNLGNSAVETDDAYWIVGSKDQDSVVLKLDKHTGNILIDRIFDLGGSDAIEALIQTPRGFTGVGYRYAVDTNNTFFTEGKGVMVFLDHQGNKLNEIDIGNYLAHGYRIEQYNNAYIVAGLTQDAQDYGLLKFDLENQLVWSKVIGGANSDHNFAMDISDDGFIYLSGHTLSGVDNWDTYTVKVDQSGDVLWEKKLGNPRGFDATYIHDEAWDLVVGRSGNVFVIAGTGDEYQSYSECNDRGCSDQWRAYLIQFDKDGNLVSQQTFSAPEAGDWAGEALVMTTDGGLMIGIDNGQFGFLKLLPEQ